MLTLSSDATLVIRNAIENSPEVPDDTGGLRVTQTDTSQGQAQMSMTLASVPEIGDQVVEDRGARVFVEPDLKNELADKQLHVAAADDRRVRFQVEDQAI